MRSVTETLELKVSKLSNHCTNTVGTFDKMTIERFALFITQVIAY